jgi:hypothetical protein
VDYNDKEKMEQLRRELFHNEEGYSQSKSDLIMSSGDTGSSALPSFKNTYLSYSRTGMLDLSKK